MSTTMMARPPRRPARARDLWSRPRVRRIALRTLGVLILAAIAVPAWGWVDHKLTARRAYRQGRATARQAIDTGHPMTFAAAPASGEVFVDPRTGLLAPEPMMMMRCIYDPYDEYRDKGYRDELADAFTGGELAPFDLRPKLRTEAETTQLFARDSCRAIAGSQGTLTAPTSGRRVAWSSGGTNDGRVALTMYGADGATARLSVGVAAPARAIFVDDGTTLVILESTGAAQILDLGTPARLAWYGGPYSAKPRP